LKRLAARPEILKEMAGRAHQAARYDAAERIARVCLEVAGNGAGGFNRNTTNAAGALTRESGGHESSEQCVPGHNRGSLSDE
jgi:hypothetical protein